MKANVAKTSVSAEPPASQTAPAVKSVNVAVTLKTPSVRVVVKTASAEPHVLVKRVNVPVRNVSLPLRFI